MIALPSTSLIELYIPIGWQRERRVPSCNESRVEKGGFGQTESKLCTLNFKNCLLVVDFLRASRGIVS